MTHRVARLRRFRFNLPQRIAAVLLALFLAQGLWLTGHQALTDRDYQYARCGREMWERASPLAGYFTSCGNIHDGVLAYRLAGLPLTLTLLAERGLDHFRKPEDKVVQAGEQLSTWELRHQLPFILLLLRLPFLMAGCMPVRRDQDSLLGHEPDLGGIGAIPRLRRSHSPQRARRSGRVHLGQHICGQW